MLEKLPRISAGLAEYGACVDVLTSAKAAGFMRRQNPDVFANIRTTHLLDDAALDRMTSGNVTLGNQILAQPELDPTQIANTRQILRDQACPDDYDIVLSPFTETIFLKAVFPKSRILFFETGLVCHLPFKQFHIFDPFGTFRSGAYFAQQIPPLIGEEVFEYQPVVDRIGAELRGFSRNFIKEAGGRSNLRRRFSRVVLLPLQVTDNPSFYGSAPFGSQFALLEYVLTKLPPDIGLLVSEHPSFPQITSIQHSYLGENYGNYIYARRLQALWSPSAVVLPAVDAVIGVSSTVLLQAHALGMRTFSLGRGSFTALNGATSFDDFLVSLRDNKPFETPRKQILNMLARYSVPQAIYQSPALGDYFKKLLEAQKEELYLPLIAEPEALLRHYESQGAPRTLVKSRSYFTNGWSSAPLVLSGNGDSEALDKLGAPVASAGASKVTVAVLLDHFGIGGTQRVLQRLITRMPDVQWVILVEKRIKEEFPIPFNCDIIECAPGSTPEGAARNFINALYRIHKNEPIDLFLNPMHWRVAALKLMQMVKDILKIPVVYWEHNSFYFPFYIGDPVLHEAREACIEAADRTVLLSEHDRTLFQCFFPKMKTQVIRNPVPDMDRDPTPYSLREKVILTVGRFDPQKRMDRCVPVMKAFAEEHPDWRMIILGDGYLRPKVAAAIAAEKLEKVIEVAGYDENPGKYFANASIVALLSDFEGDPLTLMEAKAYGIPVVAFELFQNTRLRHEVDGLVAPQEDCGAFAAHLSRLAADSELCAQFGEAGRADFLSAQNEKPEDDWYQLFDDVIAGRSGEEQSQLSLPPGMVAEAVHVLNTFGRTLNLRMNERVGKAQKEAGGSTLAAAQKHVTELEHKVRKMEGHIASDAQLLNDRMQTIETMEVIVRQRDAHIAADAELLKDRLQAIETMDTMIKERDIHIAGNAAALEEYSTTIERLTAEIQKLRSQDSTDRD